jgi:hypothetical protein
VIPFLLVIFTAAFALVFIKNRIFRRLEKGSSADRNPE